MNDPRIISLAERRPPGWMLIGPARLHALLTELVQPRGYWAGTQGELASMLPGADGRPIADRTVREWLATPELRATIIVRRAAHGSTYYVVGPLPERFRSTSDHGSDLTSDHGGSARARTSSSSSSPLPEPLPISDLPTSGLGEQYRERLSAMRCDPKPWLLDALLEYPPEVVDEALDVMRIYAPKPPPYVLRTVESVHLQCAADAAAGRQHVRYVAPAESTPEPLREAHRQWVHPVSPRPVPGMWLVLRGVALRTLWRWIT